MTTYTVHLCREMRLVFQDVEADSPEAAARRSSARATGHAHRIEDCEGFGYSPVVDRDDDEGTSCSSAPMGGEIEPPSGDVTNHAPAARAEASLSVFIQHTGCDREDTLAAFATNVSRKAEGAFSA
ncbi:MAG TPA: hypothetical protein VH062_20075 [Polyangiaceae bacterium]|jgi:hypothetical protein|nr:hypothetical protein [Polyangiaceae bacterium]